MFVFFQAQVSGVQDEDFTVDFPSILPHHPAFLYQLTGLGNCYFLLLICLKGRLKKIGLVEVDQSDFLLILVLGQISFLSMGTSKSFENADYVSVLSQRMGSCPPGLNCPEKGSCSFHIFVFKLFHILDPIIVT